MTTFNRTSISDFETRRPWYAGALVTAYTVDEDGEATETLATLYAAVTGDEELENPQRLNSEGRFDQPVYIAEPVILEIEDVATGDSHRTGIVGANLVGTLLADAQAAANQSIAFWELTRRLVAQLQDAGISAFSYTLLALTTAGDWLTGLGFSAFMKTLVPAADAATARATLGAAATAQTYTGTKSIVGGGDHSANRTFELDGDEASPGNREFYGTSAVGAKGWRPLAAEDLPAGTIIQSAFAEYTTFSSLATQIPLDDTIPQSTEGDQFLSVSITPKSASSRLWIMVQANGAAGLAANLIIALFNGGTNAIATQANTSGGGNYTANTTLVHEYAPGSTSPITFTVRGGNNAADNISLNGAEGGARFFGGTARATIKVLEIAQ